jgi:hypothetical protein
MAPFLPRVRAAQRAVRDPQDVELVRAEATQASTEIAQTLMKMAETDLGRTIRRSNGSIAVAFRRAVNDLPSLSLHEGPRAAARRYRRLAACAHALRGTARKRRRAGDHRYLAHYITELDALADASFAHAARLANTKTPRCSAPPPDMK